MLENAAVQITKSQTFERLRTTATPRDEAGIHLGLEKHLSSKKTLVDIASGFSSLVPYLLSKNYDAWAIDPIYGLSDEEVRVELDDYHKRLVEKFSFGSDHYRTRRTSTQDFSRVFPLRRDRFLKGNFESVPLPDLFADLTVSMQGITHLGYNERLVNKAIKEALRITKIGGSVILAPVYLGIEPTEYTPGHDMLLTRLVTTPGLSISKFTDDTGCSRIEIEPLAV
jgi:hypothetical protein